MCLHPVEQKRKDVKLQMKEGYPLHGLLWLGKANGAPVVFLKLFTIWHNGRHHTFLESCRKHTTFGGGDGRVVNQQLSLGVV